MATNGNTHYVLLLFISRTWTQAISGGYCTFEDGFCDWEHDTSQDFNWSIMDRHSIGVRDRQHADGYFIAITNHQNDYDLKAKLISPKYPSGHTCLKIWYSINGRKNNVKIKRKNKRRTVVYWTKDAQDWIYLYINFNMSDAFKIEIEGNIDKKNPGYVAVDDISVTTGTFCSADCNFDVGFCAWEQGRAEDDFNWKRIRGKTPNGDTGPDKDHTSGDGYYIYVESNRKSENKTARLSVLLEGDGQECLKFWFYMFGEDVNSLNVYVTTPDAGEKLVYTVSNNKGRQWIEAQIDIFQHGDYQITLEGVAGSDDEGDIAVDDITIGSGVCKQSEKGGSLTALYVSIPLIIVVVVAASIAFIIWRKRHTKDVCSSETQRQAWSRKETSPNTSITNKTYAGQFTEKQNIPTDSNARNVGFGQTEYAMINDSKLQDDGNNAGYDTTNMTVKVQEDRDYGYDRLKQSPTPFFDKSYSHLVPKENDISSAIESARKGLPASGNEVVSKDRIETYTNDSETFPGVIIQNESKFPFEIEDETDIEYDHAKAGGPEPTDSELDDYSHLHNESNNASASTATAVHVFD